MKVAFLTLSTSMHINIKAKYFEREDDLVYFFAMKYKHKSSDLDVPLAYKENIHVVQLFHEDNDYE